jgi:energy-converting hydrogenase Eha subunit C
MMAVALVAVISVFFGAIMDAIMRDDGFGPVGNMMLITAGFFASILLADYSGIAMAGLTLAAVAGLSGAFVTLAVLALFKAGLAGCSLRQARPYVGYPPA